DRGKNSRRKAYRERDLRTVDDAREDVLAQVVGTQGKLPTGRLQPVTDEFARRGGSDDRRREGHQHNPNDDDQADQAQGLASPLAPGMGQSLAERAFLETQGEGVQRFDFLSHARLWSLGVANARVNDCISQVYYEVDQHQHDRGPKY